MAMFLTTLPWLLLLAVLPFLLRQRPSLASYAPVRPPRPGPPAESPLVSVIVPTHDDAGRVGACLATLLDSDYPNYEVLVADDGSQDGTREIVAALEARAPARVRLVDTGVAPVGWATPAWSCWRASEAARGQLLLFTRPGTLHDAELLPRAMVALERERADLVSVYPRLTMQGFWERLVMPHIWLVLTARLPTASAVNRWQDPADAVASSHCMLFRREAYEAIGGHQAVGSGPEASTLARAVLRSGRRVFLVHGEAHLETRMYRTLAGIADELIVATPAAARTGAPPWIAVAVAWLVAATPVIFFVVPPVTLLASLLGVVSGPAGSWALRTTAMSLILWLVIYARHRIRPAYAVAYPAGALVSSLAFSRGILLREDR
jgi:cellulose synthase/poly-beta-1,6-N-acetylglucosamine synthase-like glycosyltransferase